MEMPSKLTPALIGGGVMGFLSALPVIQAGNCVCCMWIIGGGIIAGYVYCKALPPGVDFKGGDGALVGLLAGIFGALFSTFLTYLFSSMGIMPGKEIIQAILKNAEDIPIEFEEMLKEMQNTQDMNVAFAMIGLISSMIMNSIFAMIGGLISTALFKNKKTITADEVTLL